MAITLDDLTVNFAHVDAGALLDSWRWLIGAGRQPVLVTALGDAFVQDPDDGRVLFLDTITPALDRIADDASEFRALLSDREFVVAFFSPGKVVAMRETGKLLQSGQIYSYRIPPVLGGSQDPDNIEVTDLEVHFAILGQTHERLKDVPEGTPVSGAGLG